MADICCMCMKPSTHYMSISSHKDSSCPVDIAGRYCDEHLPVRLEQIRGMFMSSLKWNSEVDLH